MTISMLWLFSAGLLVAAVYLPFANRAPGAVRSTLKTAPLALFCLCAAGIGASPYLTLALLFSALGDFALSRSGRKMFLWGLAAFTLSHVFYVLFFLAESGAPLWAAFITAPILASLLLAFAFSSELWLSPFAGALRWPLRLYTVLITLMMLAALTTWPINNWFAVGGGLFLASDVVLAVQIFRMIDGTKTFAVVRIAIWLAYISGQALILWGAVGG